LVLVRLRARQTLINVGPPHSPVAQSLITPEARSQAGLLVLELANTYELRRSFSEELHCSRKTPVGNCQNVPGLPPLLHRSLTLSKPLKIQIVELARTLISDEQHWCRRHFGEDADGFPVSPTSASAIRWCGLGAVIAAAYQLTRNTDAAYQVGYQILRPRYGSATLIHTNDVRGHAAVLALFDEVTGRARDLARCQDLRKTV
jgi:hypothetical protein